jgi:hypothetical protein
MICVTMITCAARVKDASDALHPMLGNAALECQRSGLVGGSRADVQHACGAAAGEICTVRGPQSAARWLESQSAQLCAGE